MFADDCATGTDRLDDPLPLEIGPMGDVDVQKDPGPRGQLPFLVTRCVVRERARVRAVVVGELQARPPMPQEWCRTCDVARPFCAEDAEMQYIYIALVRRLGFGQVNGAPRRRPAEWEVLHIRNT